MLHGSPFDQSVVTIQAPAEKIISNGLIALERKLSRTVLQVALSMMELGLMLSGFLAASGSARGSIGLAVRSTIEQRP